MEVFPAEFNFTFIRDTIIVPQDAQLEKEQQIYAARFRHEIMTDFQLAIGKRERTVFLTPPKGITDARVRLVLTELAPRFPGRITVTSLSPIYALCYLPLDCFDNEKTIASIKIDLN